MKKILVMASFALLTIYISAQSKIISTQKAIDDVWYLKVELEETHPNLYDTLPEEQFSDLLNGVIDRFDDEVKCDSLNHWLTPVVNQLNDGHTRISKYQSEVKAQAYFPLKLDLKNNSVAQDNEYGIPRGAMVSYINSIALNDITEHLLLSINGEKHNNRLADLEYTFPYWLHRDYGFDNQFTVDYIYNNKRYTKTIGGRSQSKFFTKYSGGIEGNFRIVENDTMPVAYLKLSMFGNSKGYYQLVDSCFEQANAQNINRLIIDIRDNPGGNTRLAEHIFQYIAKDTYALYDSTLMKYSKQSRRLYRNYGWRKPYLLPILIAMRPYWKTKGERIDSNFSMPVYLNDEERYKGQVFLITSGYCYSTADDFTRVFKYYDMGTIIGEETGGMRNSYGDVLRFKLPNSKIECGCSYKYYYGLNLSDKPDEGVKPDIELACTNLSDVKIINVVFTQ